MFKVYGEELDFVFTEVRKKGCRRLIIDGKPVDISEEVDLDEARRPGHGRGGGPLRRQPEARKGDQGGDRRHAAGRRRAHPDRGAQGREQGGSASGSTKGLCSPTHHFVYGGIEPEYFMFNNPESACRTCGGLGIHKLTHPELLVPDPQAQHPRRLFRARSVQVQPGHLGWPSDVQPGEDAAFLARYAVGKAARIGAQTPSSTASSRRKS